MPEKEKEKKEQEESKDNTKEENESVEDSEEVSELEKEIEIEEEKIKINIPNIADNQFNQEIELENSSPSLEKVNAPQKNTFVRLEQNVGDAPISDTKDEDNQFKYSAASKSSENAKYVSYDNISSEMLSAGEIEREARKNPLEKMQEVGFMPSERPDISSDKKYEVYNPSFKQDLTKIGKESEFEKLQQKEIKYKPSAA